MFEELKVKQSVMWGNGPYEKITDLLTESQQDLVAALKPQAGEKWLDVATGTGAVARMAARAGADVTGLDLAPDLIETARGQTEAEGLSIRFDVGDAEALIEWDERINFWRIRHFKVVERVIGGSVVGTQGTPVEVLGRLIHHVFFPELWRVRNELTALSQEQQ